MAVPASKFDRLTFSWLGPNGAKIKKIYSRRKNLVFKCKSAPRDPPDLPLGAPDPHIWVTQEHPTNILVE